MNMRIKTFGLAIGIIACILLLFSILLFVPGATPSKKYPIIRENTMLPGYLAGNETDELIDNGNGTVTILLYPMSLQTGKKIPIRIDNVSVVWGYSYAPDGKKVINEVRLTAVQEPRFDASIVMMSNGSGWISVYAETSVGYYHTEGIIRHPLTITPARETNESAPAFLYPPLASSSNESAGLSPKLIPFNAGNQTVYVQGYDKHRIGPAMQWDHIYGNGSANVILETDDGGYLIAGRKEEAISGHAGSVQKTDRAWIGKIDTNGKLLWDRTYDGSNIESIMKQGDKYVATGYVDNGHQSLWVLETDAFGNVTIERAFNNSSFNREGVSIAPTADGGYMITGNDKYPDYKNYAFVARMDDNLSLLWDREFSDYGLTYGNAIISTNADNFVVCGGEDGNIVEITADGNMLWNMTLGELSGILPISILPTDDGEYIVAYLDITARWQQGIMVSKIKPDGTIDWNKVYYGAGSAYTLTMCPTDDGGYTLAGYTNGVISGLYVIKIDDTGSAIWSEVYDHPGAAARAIIQSDDGWYMLAIDSDSQIEVARLDSLARKDAPVDIKSML